ncbi:hypothetical protein M446_0815 [Methylobacterium sp. 4-46]|nr:hypothetical protein M446_0815 [Methylobacterium sp. 4-46]
MSRVCRAPGCSSPAASRFSLYCKAHKARLRRHGAVDQVGVTEAVLGSYRRLVRARVEKNKESPLWGQLEARWATIVSHAQGIVDGYHRGQVGYAFERRAAQEVLKLAADVEPKAVVETALAMFLLLEAEPRRFRSDAGFRAQLVRRVRGLTDMNVGTYWDDESGTMKRVYREVPPRAIVVMGQWLAEAFGGAGTHMARLEEKDRQERESARQDFYKSLEELR